MKMQPRWFFALVPDGLPESSTYRSVLGRLKRSAKEHEWAVKWTPPEQIHITLAFLGPLAGARIEPLMALGSEVACRTACLRLELEQLGAFPEIEAGRVVWIGVRRTRALVGLHRQLQETLVAQGFPRDEHEFLPHVTLGRLRHARRLDDWLSPFRRRDFGRYSGQELKLLTSHGASPHVRYQEEGVWPLCQLTAE